MRTPRRVAAVLAVLLAIPLWACCPDPCPDPCPSCDKLELGVTVELVSKCTLIPEEVNISRSGNKPNHMRWHNRTSETQTVSFHAELWPFMEAHGDIVIEAGQYSAWYTAAPGGTTGEPLSYKVRPLRDASCPPGEPAVTTDP